MPRTYAQISDEVKDLEAKQRDITGGENEPTADEMKDLWKLQGEVIALSREKDNAHAAELAVVQNAPTATQTDVAKEMGFRTMVANDEMDIQFVRQMTHPKANGGRPGKIKEAKAILRSDTGSGANLVPEEWHATVEEYRFERNFVRTAGATVITTESTHNIPVLTALSSPAIVGENTAYTDSDPTVENVVLNAYKLSNKINISEELLADAAYDVDGMLARAVGLGLGAAEEALFLTGTGSSEPVGIFNQTANDTFDSASALTNDEIIEIIYGLARHYRPGAVWMMNDATVLVIATQKLTVTTSGTLDYFWQNSVDGEPPRLLGYPVFTNSNIATITNDAKVIGFGNLENYVIGERGPLNLKRLQLNEYSDTFAYHQRIDGKPLNEDAFEIWAMGS